METYKLGTRIYYTGDMANCEDAGTIVAVHSPNRFTSFASYDIDLDDGRKMVLISHISFGVRLGRHFWLLDEWRADRKRRIEDMVADMKAHLEH